MPTFWYPRFTNQKIGVKMFKTIWKNKEIQEFMNKKKTPVKFVMILIALIAVLGILAFVVSRVSPTKERMNLQEYYNLSDDEVAVITDDGVQTENGRIIDGEIYLPYKTVSQKISGSIFYDSEQGTVIVTTPTEKMRFDAANEVRVTDDVTYVALDLVADYSNARITKFKDPERIVVRSNSSYNTEKTVKNASVRYRAGIHSKVLTEVPEGDDVRVIDVYGDGSTGSEKVEGWTMVQTEDGLRGYVEDRYLDGKVTETTDEPVLKLGDYTHLLLDDPVNMLFHQVTSQASNNALIESIANVTGVNVIAPTWFFLDSAAGEQTSLVNASYVETAHGLGMQVWAVMNDFDGAVNAGDETQKALSADAVREKLVADTIAQVLSVGADGINIDYENVTEECAPYFLQFIREMSIGCRNAGLVLSVCNYVPTFTGYMNRKEQARVADYVVCMCYDEHLQGSPEAGSVSSLPFVQAGINDTLKEVPNQQTIIAIPFYTRLWMTTSQAAPDSQALGMSAASGWVAERGLDTNWDKEAAQNYAEMQDDTTYYQIWLEDASSVEEKMKLIEDADCAGVAEWKLGMETPDIWDVISSHLE